MDLHSRIRLPMQATWRDLSARYRYLIRYSAIVLDARERRKLRRVLLQPPLRALASERVDLSRKYLWPCLSREFTRRERLALILAHYRILAASGGPSLARRLLESPEVVWERWDGTTRLAISLCFLGPQWDQEGEMCLLFEVDDRAVYRLSFTIGEGALFGRDERRVLFIGGVQGSAGRLELIRRATRGCHDVAPRSCLLAAAAGMARSLGIDAIIAVGNDTHVTRATISPEQFSFDYDQFWTEMGGASSDRYFVFPLPLVDKPLGLVNVTHRRRAVRRREFRSRVADVVYSHATGQLGMHPQ